MMDERRGDPGEGHAGVVLSDEDRERLLGVLRAGPPPAGTRPERIRLAIGEVVVKRHAPSIRERISRLVGRPGRLERALRVGQALHAAGVRVARPLAAIEDPIHRGGPGILALEAIDGSNLRELILSRGRALTEPEARRSLLASIWSVVASEVARLHGAGARQRDLKAPNIVLEDLPGGALAAWLIDLDGMSLLARPPSRRTRVRDLARLAVSLREEAVRAVGVGPEDWTFLVRRYLEESSGRGPAQGEVDAFVEDTLAWARRKEARSRRRGSVIQ